MAVASTALPDVRADFPVLGAEIDGKRLCYLDSAATSLKPAARHRRDRQATTGEINATIHRGMYRLAQEATDLFEGARERIARFCGWDPATTLFTRNATEAINLVAYAWGRENVGPGDEVLITEMEHHSNIVPWQLSVPGARRRLCGTCPSPTRASSRWTSSTRCSPRAG